MAKKAPKYKVTKSYLGLDTGFIQAATLLDMAALHATERNDVTQMLQVAQQWVDFSATMREALGPPSEEGDDDEEEDSGSKSHRSAPVGFGVTAKELTDHHGRTNKN